MKFSFIIVIFLVVANCQTLRGQTIKFVPNKDSIQLGDNFLVWNNKLYFLAVSKSLALIASPYILAECDKEIKAIPMPDGFISVAYDSMWVYNNKLYLILQKLKPDGSTFQKPYTYNGFSFTSLRPQSFAPEGPTTIYNGKLYSTYEGLIIRLDGDNFQPIPGIENVSPAFMEYKGKLIFGSADALYTYDGNNFKAFYCNVPSLSENFIVKGIIFKNNLYTTYVGTSNFLPLMGMARFDGATLQFIDNPSPNLINDCDFSVFDNNLYYSFRSLTDGNYCQLVQYNGTSTQLFLLPPNTKYAFNKPRIAMNNKLYMLVENYSKPSSVLIKLAVLDNGQINVIDNPDGKNIGSDIFLFNNKIYGSCADKNSKNTMFEFDGITFKYFDLPIKSSYFFHPMIFKNTLYFITDGKLAYLDYTSQ